MQRPPLAKSARRLLSYLRPFVARGGGRWLDLPPAAELAARMSKSGGKISERTLDRAYEALEAWEGCELVFSSANRDQGRGRIKRVAARSWIEALEKHDRLPLHFRADGRPRGTRRSFRRVQEEQAPAATTSTVEDRPIEESEKGAGGAEFLPPGSLPSAPGPTAISGPRTPEPPAAATTPKPPCRRCVGVVRGGWSQRKFTRPGGGSGTLAGRLAERRRSAAEARRMAEDGLYAISNRLPEVRFPGGSEGACWPEAMRLGGLASLAQLAMAQTCTYDRWLNLVCRAAYLGHAAWRDRMTDRPAAYAMGCLRFWLRGGALSRRQETVTPRDTISVTPKTRAEECVTPPSDALSREAALTMLAKMKAMLRATAPVPDAPSHRASGPVEGVELACD